MEFALSRSRKYEGVVELLLSLPPPPTTHIPPKLMGSGGAET